MTRLTVDEARGRAALSVVEAAGLLGIGRTAAYEAVRAGELPSLRIGGRVLAPVVPLLELVGLDHGPDGREAEVHHLTAETA